MEKRFDGVRLGGVALYFEAFSAAVAYYEHVFGPPDYVEGMGTREWQLGETVVTLLRGTAGAPHNLEVILVMPTPVDAERLQAAFLAAGGTGEPPTDQVMGRPVRYCPVQDPFGTNLLIVSSLP